MTTCEVCFDSYDEPVPEQPCGHRVCELCLRESEGESRPCPASNVCDGLPLLEDHETAEEAFARISREISNLETEVARRQIMVVFEVDRITEKHAAIDRQLHRKRLSYLFKRSYLPDILNLANEQLQLWQSKEYARTILDRVPELRDCEWYQLWSLFMVNETVQSIGYRVEGTVRYVHYDRDDGITFPHSLFFHKFQIAYQLPFGTCKLKSVQEQFNSEKVKFVPYDYVTLPYPKYLNPKKYQDEIEQIRKSFEQFLDHIATKEKQLEQRLEKLINQVPDHSLMPEPMAPKVCSVSGNLVGLSQEEIRYFKSKLLIVSHLFGGITNKPIKFMVLTIRSGLQISGSKPFTGGIGILFTKSDKLLVAFKGDPFKTGDLKRRLLAIRIKPYFSLSEVFVDGGHVLFPSTTSGKYNAISIQPESYGKYDRVATSVVYEPIESPWKNKNDYSFFTYEPTGATYLCAMNAKNAIPYAMLR